MRHPTRRPARVTVATALAAVILTGCGGASSNVAGATVSAGITVDQSSTTDSSTTSQSASAGIGAQIDRGLGLWQEAGISDYTWTYTYWFSSTESATYTVRVRDNEVVDAQEHPGSVSTGVGAETVEDTYQRLGRQHADGVTIELGFDQTTGQLHSSSATLSPELSGPIVYFSVDSFERE